MQPHDKNQPVRLGVIGAGFWAQFQCAAWKELSGVVCAAICDRARARAEALAQKIGIPAVYDDAEEMLRREKLDLVDVITDPESHAQFVRLAAAHHLPVICQKPMAPSLAESEDLVRTCREARVPFFVHENWRWQKPIREVKRILDEGRIGTPFRARIDVISGFPVFKNQPSLKELDQFILADMGVHLLDTARFLFGEAQSVHCATHRVHRDIRGEDVATVLLRMNEGKTTVLCEMAYVENPIEKDYFPQTMIFVEAERGSLELAADYWVRVTTSEGTLSRRHAPAMYSWIDPAYAVVHSSMVDLNGDFLRALEAGTLPETHAGDNLKTVQLVFDAYAAAGGVDAGKSP